MILAHLGFLLTTLATFANAQLTSSDAPIVLDAIHNATSITGTWSSGSRAVITGPGFANPVNQTFAYPRNTGVSFSFSDDGHYEIARYRFNANGSHPTCIIGVINWSHGSFNILPNGTMILTPFGDGFQQVQDPCAAVSNFIEPFNYTEVIPIWRIYNDINDGFKLHLFQFDGIPYAPLFQISASPEMLPTQRLRNDTAQDVDGDGEFVKRDIDAAAPARWTSSLGLAAGAIVVSLASMAL